MPLPPLAGCRQLQAAAARLGGRANPAWAALHPYAGVLYHEHASQMSAPAPRR